MGNVELVWSDSMAVVDKDGFCMHFYGRNASLPPFANSKNIEWKQIFINISARFVKACLFRYFWAFCIEVFDGGCSRLTIIEMCKMYPCKCIFTINQILKLTKAK